MLQFQYNLSLDQPRADDTVIEQNGVKLFLDQLANNTSRHGD